MNKLPTREEFIKILADKKEIDMDEWNKELFQCPQCGGAVKRDYSTMYATFPPKYRYFCRDCGNYSEFI